MGFILKSMRTNQNFTSLINKNLATSMRIGDAGPYIRQEYRQEYVLVQSSTNMMASITTKS